MSKFNVGDKVRVKTWDDMVKIGTGVNYNGIQFGDKPTFVELMRKYCGNIFTVSQVNYSTYKLRGIEKWQFHDDMLESIEEESMHEKLKLMFLRLQTDLENKLESVSEPINSNRFEDVIVASEMLGKMIAISDILKDAFQDDSLKDSCNVYRQKAQGVFAIAAVVS